MNEKNEKAFDNLGQDVIHANELRLEQSCIKITNCREYSEECNDKIIKA
jgi:hypothetical protein